MFVLSALIVANCFDYPPIDENGRLEIIFNNQSEFDEVMGNFSAHYPVADLRALRITTSSYHWYVGLNCSLLEHLFEYVQLEVFELDAEYISLVEMSAITTYLNPGIKVLRLEELGFYSPEDPLKQEFK